MKKMETEKEKEMWRLAAKPGTLQSSAHVLHMHMKVYACVCVRDAIRVAWSVGLIRYRAYRRHRHPRRFIRGVASDAARIKQSNSLYSAARWRKGKYA